MAKFILVLFVCLGCHLKLFCQSTIIINGFVKNSKGQSIQRASINISEKNKSVIVGYTFTDDKGYFILETTCKSDSIILTVTSIGYATLTKQLKNISDEITLQLKEEARELKEVIVKQKPIAQNGDTLSYNVSAFQSKNDRAIADVLRKLPGVEVDDDGRVKYQGVPIEKYYIEGMDLLEGRYNLANNNLPADAVAQVQILENHQPFKILDSLNRGNKPSLNIKLKKNFTTTGTGKLGTGFSPALWDVNLTPMVFTPKFQAIGSLQTNNTGNDVGRDLKILTFDEILQKTEGNTDRVDWLGTPKAGLQNVQEPRYLFNKGILATANYIFKVKKGGEVRVNLHYLNDVQIQQGNNLYTYLLPTGDTVKLNENFNNRYKYQTLQSSVNFTQNSKRIYLTDNLSSNINWDGQTNAINSSVQGNLAQQTKLPFQSVTNKFQVLARLGKQLVNMKSTVSYSNSPQNMVVSPGSLSNILNDSIPYQQATQQTSLQNFVANNSLGFVKKIKWITIEPNVGFSYQKQLLKSSLHTLFGTKDSLLPPAYQNNMDWQQSKLYFGSGFSYKSERLNVTANAKFTYYGNNNFFKGSSNYEINTGLLFEPSINARFQIGNYWEISGGVAQGGIFGKINEHYFGYMLTDYHTLQANSTPLTLQKITNFSGRLAYKNPLKSLFLYANYSYSNIARPFFPEIVIQPNGTQILDILVFDNNVYQHLVNANVAKYLSAIKTNISIGGLLGIGKQKQVINGIAADAKNTNANINLRISTRFTDWIDMALISSNSFYANTVGQSPATKSSQFSQSLKLNFNPVENQSFGTLLEYGKSILLQQKPETFFADLFYRYSFSTKKIDLEAKWSNIFDNKIYTTQQSDKYTITQNSFLMRPSQILFSIKFRF